MIVERYDVAVSDVCSVKEMLVLLSEHSVIALSDATNILLTFL